MSPAENQQDRPGSHAGPGVEQGAEQGVEQGADHGTGEPQDTAAPRPGGAPGPTGQDIAEEGGDMTEGARGPGADQAQQTEATEPTDMAGDSPNDLVIDLARAQQDVSNLTSDLQRLQAEYVNYKRRVDRDRELVKQNATFQVLSGLLPVLDDIDRAREHGELEGGFKAVADSLERTVSGLGLVRFGEPGDAFDPNLHDALMHAHSPDVTMTTCQSIIQAGYRIGDRVVRAARVTVVDPEPDSEPDSQPDSRSDGPPAAGGTVDEKA